MNRYATRFLGLAALGLAAVAAFSAAAPARSTAAPRNTGQPSIRGNFTVGHTVTINNGTWAGSPTSFQYQWLRCDNPGKTNCGPIPGATHQSYRLTSGDAGHTITANVTACNRDGCSTAQTDAYGPVKSNAKPVNTAAPTISGTPVVGATLTAVEGTWANVPTSFGYQWLRCDVSGNACGAIAAATAKAYAVSSDDFGNTLRVTVTARNAQGSVSATSGPSAVVGKSTQGGVSVSVNAVRLPDRLVISGVQSSPARIHHAPFTVRFRVSDTAGRVIDGALVYVVGLPYNWVATAPEVATGPDGWATVTLRPSSAMPRRGALVMFVRARKPGDDVLAGVSTRRLVQVSIAG